jgi:O-antigen biosynthesis protein
MRLALRDALPFSGIYGDARALDRVRLTWHASFRSATAALQQGGLRNLARAWCRRAWDGFTAAFDAGRAPTAALDSQVASTGAAPRPLRVLAMINSYGLEGAPTAVLDVLAHLHHRHGAQVRVVAGEDGPLRERARQRGLAAAIEPRARLAGDSADEYAARLAGLGLGDGDDIVIAGSLAAAMAVPIARMRGLPSLLYVQESLRLDQAVAALFAGDDPRQARRLVVGALREATRVCFTAEATRDLFAAHDRGHFRAIPDTIDADAVVARSRGASRAEVRRRHGVPIAALVVLCVGTVCHRKGQQVLVEALGRMRRRPPELRCLLVGLREAPELAVDVEAVRAAVTRLGLKDVVRLVPETDAGELFALAFPRAVLEAMAFGLPIVATRTGGIVEQLDEHSAWLCEPGDSAALGLAVESCLQDRDEAARRGARAGVRVRERFAAGPGLERHAALVFETANAGRVREAIGT